MNKIRKAHFMPQNGEVSIGNKALLAKETRRHLQLFSRSWEITATESQGSWQIGM